MPEHRQKCSNRYSGGGSHLQHNTPRAVRRRSTGKNVPSAPASTAPVCGRGTPAPLGPGPAARRAVGSIEVPPGSLVVRQLTDLRSWSPHHPKGRSPHPRPQRPSPGDALEVFDGASGPPESPIFTLTPWTGQSARLPIRAQETRSRSATARSRPICEIRSSRSSWTRSTRSSCIPAFTPWSCFSRQRFWPSSRMRSFVALSPASRDDNRP